MDDVQPASPFLCSMVTCLGIDIPVGIVRW